jgi:bifunctional pyridoxal-dependent enzyme with beta-cystathionase and maltose regulon repressor activities
MATILAYHPRVDAMLGGCRLGTLTKRKGHEWRMYPGDVLPAFVAETDFDLPTLSAGPGFGAQGRGFARLNMGTSPELIEEAVRRMAAAVAT